jgi:hypothetical protein
MITETRNVARAHMGLMQGNWRENFYNTGAIWELKGKTVGIVGFGNIGHLMAERLYVSFGCRVLVNDIYQAAEDAEIIEDTLFIVIADHGGTNPGNGQGGGHGGWTDGEKYVTFAATGKGIKRTEIKEMNIRDLAAIVLYALCINIPDFDEEGWTSQIPDGIFADASIPAYRDISHLTGAAPRISKVPHTSELI